MREGVLVVVSNRRETDERGLFVQNLIDDALHDALDLSDVRRLANADGIDDVLRHRYGLRIGAVCSSLRLFVELLVCRSLSRLVELERVDLDLFQAADDFL